MASENPVPPQVVNIKDEKVYELLFRTHYASLVSFSVSYVGEPETAEEIVQDVFLNIWSKSENLNIQTSIKSYLFGAVRNASLNFLKHQKVEKAYAEEQFTRLDKSDETNHLELDELKEKISLALDKIPEKCREIFELSRFEGKRYKEIAEELNISLKTVENQMGKALKIMRQELGDYLPLIILFIFQHGGKF
ncbi:MAG: RNA polymerase sigma-70 factor [Cyclobacteriaceae bacterium]